MNSRQLIFSFILSVAGLVIGVFFLKFYNCQPSIFCYNLITKSSALFYGMSALAVIFFFLLLFPQAVENWKKFAKWFVPITALIFIFYDGPGPGDLLSPYPEQVFRWLSILYVVASLLIVAWSLTGKRHGGKVSQ
jgi:hypothetical protein